MTIVQDLASASRGASNAETRQIAWALLLRLARDGDADARDAIENLSRTSKRHGNGTIGDTLNSRTEKDKNMTTLQKIEAIGYDPDFGQLDLSAFPHLQALPDDTSFIDERFAQLDRSGQGQGSAALKKIPH
jgi:hypothetical protein